MSKKLIYLMSFVLVLAVTGTASADQWDITVPDAGFDDHVLNNVGDYIYVGDAAYTGAWKSAGGDAWIDYGYWAGDIDLPALSGNNKLYPWEDVEDYVYQILDETFIEGGTYTLSVWVGIAWSDYADGWWLYFTGEDYNNNLIETSGNAPVGSWQQVSLVYTATAADAGKKVGIKMTGAIYVTFEDVTLSYDGPPRPPIATNPTPADGAMLSEIWVSLGWSPGETAVSHDVYLGDNFDDVNNGTPETFRGNQPLSPTTFFVGFVGCPYPDGLVPGTTYYWRIDEVNDTDPNSPWKGPVWSFWIQSRIAYEPVPADGAKFIDPNADLNWTAGIGASFHYVYFGDNFDDVNSAVEGLLRAETTYTPGTLELDKTYYWRVDESTDAVTMLKGDVWSFKTLPEIPITDPNLVGWWTLDEGMGTTAVDWSGHGNHGTLYGNPQRIIGYDGDALDFDGTNDYVGTGKSLLNNMSEFTLAGWVSAGNPEAGRIGLFGQNDLVEFGFQGGDIHIYTSGGGEARTAWTLPNLTWHHITAVGDGTSLTVYVDGEVVVTGGSTTASYGTAGFTFNIGGGGVWDASGNWFSGQIDDVRVYNKALTAEEILLAMRGDPLLAGAPKPDNWSTPYIRDATPLSWSPGENASQHDVYFGTDRDAVADANASDLSDKSDTTGVYRGRQFGTSYTPPDIEWGGGPYYWRIDEYNTDATIGEGKIWSFTVADFILVDDFESYNDLDPDDPESNRIFNTWIDGWEIQTNGSIIGYAESPFAEQSIVHSGSQSMPYEYDINFKYSEATMTLVSVRDWTEEGVEVLSLWFYGDAANAAELMYVALNGGTAVYHDNADAAQIEEWTEWTIELQEFTGVNLTNVNTLAIGFGDKNNLQAGGSGLVLFDDIRLYRPAPEPEPQP